jgi:hypothetical protein
MVLDAVTLERCGFAGRNYRGGEFLIVAAYFHRALNGSARCGLAISDPISIHCVRLVARRKALAVQRFPLTTFRSQ